MKYIFSFLQLFFSVIGFGQKTSLIGRYIGIMPGIQLCLFEDSSFDYNSIGESPTFYRWEEFHERGRWIAIGDTVILNPQLSKKVFVESEFLEGSDKNDSSLLLSFNHIKRKFDKDGQLIQSDTEQIKRLDFSINERKTSAMRRVTPEKSVRCSFAGYIPQEILTRDRSITTKRPTLPLKCIYIGCYELQDTKEFQISNSDANHLTLNVYSNYYQDGQIRQMKLRVKNKKVIYLPFGEKLIKQKG